MPVDYVAVRTGILMGIEPLASRAAARQTACEGGLYDLLQDLSQSGALSSDDVSPALRNEREAAALRRLGRSLDQVRAAVGKTPDVAPQEFVAHPLWTEVTKSARAALAQMTDGMMEGWRFRSP